jgi:hypothetical protein
MNIDPEPIDALVALGYNDLEARFVYLVATHSGFFTLEQFNDFVGSVKGRPALRFTQKLVQRKHARATEFAHRTRVFEIYSRRIYGQIGRENLRNRRRLSNELIHDRLLVLDFVLGHRESVFLETEADKVKFFHQTLGIPLTLLPGRIFRGLESNVTTVRHFVDRSPISLIAGFPPVSAPRVTFGYCDREERDLTGFTSHLKHYEGLLRRLPAFDFIYACPGSYKFSRAKGIFYRLFDLEDSTNIEKTVRYFELRRLWDEKRYNLVDRAGRDLLRWGKQHARLAFLDAAYHQWLCGTLAANEIVRVLKPDPVATNIGFSTCLLPRKHDLFQHVSVSRDKTAPSRQCPNLAPLPLPGRPAKPPRSREEA